MTGSELTITFNLDLASSNLEFVSHRSGNRDQVITRGYLNVRSFNERVQLLESSGSSFDLLIFDLKTWDSGVFYLRDLNGNSVKTVDLEVLGE